MLVKTHRWSDDWDPATADHIFLTHRDLRGVLASYERVGWAWSIPDSYVEEHFKWKASCHCLMHAVHVGEPEMRPNANE